ncbi:MAG: aminoacetone oxidase family FAD-binding enzyme [Candidatus Onthovivens sp.]|nr:aminoacetone oxidase family FAD-binding enzyme [Candidatus Onthovivens sp.]
MNILIVGSGCSAVYLASLISFYKKEIRVDILCNDDVIGKKILITGNGRCNLGNLGNIGINEYNNEITKDIVSSFSIENIISFLSNIGIHVTTINNLVYPYSLSSKNYREFLSSFVLNNKNVKVLKDLKFVDYISKNNEVEVQLNNNIKTYDKIVFATGGISGNNKNSAEIIGILKKHNYVINPFRPGLVPIKTKEKTALVNGKRVKCDISLLKNNKLIYKEHGEVLFKKDGLSGISIFNCSSLINRSSEIADFVISLDLFPDYDLTNLINLLTKFNKSNTNYLLHSFFDKDLSLFILKMIQMNKVSKYNEKEIKSLAFSLKNLKFHYESTYDFKDSQVSIGGISYSNLNITSLESLLEKNIYFIGEILDSDGLCGGYNLMFAFASAFKVLNSL